MIGYYEQVAAAFDRAAASYHRDYAANPIMAWLEDDAFEQLCRLFPAGSRLLEIGCGPGAMALRLAAAGRTVVATDIAPAMVAQAERVTADHPTRARLTWLVAAAAQIGERVAGAFDGAYSNLGPLNCEPDLGRFASGLARLLRPEAIFFCSVMNRVCAWEIVWGLSHFRWREATRRLGRGWRMARMSAGPGEPPTEFPVRYYSPGEFAAALKPHFRAEQVMGYPVIIPPPYLASRFPNAPGRLSRIERRARRIPGLRALGDHFVIVFRCQEADER
jgi:SAM-dependent methyltransferase